LRTTRSADGEWLGLARSVQVVVRPSALRVVRKG